MLVQQNKYDNDTIVTFKLVNGDEVVAKVVEDKIDRYVISKPCSVMPAAQGIGLVQSLFTSDLEKTVELDKRHVMFHTPTIKQVEAYYIQTTTGIEPVTNKIIT